MTKDEIAAKVRTSVAFFLRLNEPSTPSEIEKFDALLLKDRPLRDEQAANIADSIRKKMRRAKPTFMLASTEVKAAAKVADLITTVQGRMK